MTHNERLYPSPLNKGCHHDNSTQRLFSETERMSGIECVCLCALGGVCVRMCVCVCVCVHMCVRVCLSGSEWFRPPAVAASHSSVEQHAKRPRSHDTNTCRHTMK